MDSDSNVGWFVAMEQHLLSDPAIKQCKILAIDPTDTTPEWTVAVSLEEGDNDGVTDTVTDTVTMELIHKRLCDKLRSSEKGEEIVVPRRWISLDSLPTDLLGVVDTASLRSQLGGQPPQAAETDPLVEMLRKIVADALNLSLLEVTSTSSFVELGGDSITAIEVMANCLEEDVILEVPDIVGCSSLVQLASLAISEENLSETDTLRAPLDALRTAYADLELDAIDYYNVPENWESNNTLLSREFTVPLESERLPCNVLDLASGLSLTEVCVASVVDSFQKSFVDRDLPLSLTVGLGSQPSVVRALELSAFEDEPLIQTLRRVKDWMKNAEQLDATVNLGKAASSSLFTELLVHVVDLQETGTGGQKVLGQPSIQETRQWALDIGLKPMFVVLVVLEKEQVLFHYQYHDDLVDDEMVSEWAHQCHKALDNSLTLTDPLYSLTDFPLMPISYEDLDTFVDNLKQLRQLEVESIYRCSPVQEGILLAQIRIQDAYRIETILDWNGHNKSTATSNTLEKAWRALVSRYAALRTAFLPSTRDGASFDQVVLKNFDPDIRTLEEVPNDRAEAIAALQALDPMTFTYDRPPHRLTTVTTHDGHYLCKLEMSHVIVDGFSVAVLLREWELALAGTLMEISASTPTPAAFSDYISFLQTQPSDTPLNYWIRYLDGIQPCHFPVLTDTAPPSSSSTAVSSATIDFGAAALFNFGRAHAVTVSSLLQAVWGLVLREYTQSEDVCFGYLASGRDAPLSHMKSMVGCLVNLLVCRIRFDGLDTLAELLHHVQRDRAPGLVNQNVSMGVMQNAVLPNGPAFFNSLLSVMLESPDSSLVTTATPEMEQCTEFASTEVCWPSQDGQSLTW